MNTVRITVLADNAVAARNARGEHGLCYHLEIGGHRVLFDTGQGLVLADNARALDIDLGAVDAIALSHGHYDHTGGLPAVLNTANGPVTVHLHPDALQSKYNKTRSIGMPLAARETLARPNCRLVFSRETGEIIPGLFHTGEIPRPHPEEALAEIFHLDSEGTKPDPLRDDQSLFFDTPEGVVVLLGCAHAGVIHTLEYIETLTGHRPVRAVLGGMHLSSTTPARIQWVLEQLRGFAPRILVPMHCTGPQATAALWHEFPDQMRPGGAGAVFEFKKTTPRKNP